MTELRLLTTILNTTILIAIVAFCLLFGASFGDFICFLLGWKAMVGWIRISSGVFPTFNGFPCSTFLVLAYVAFVLVSTWIALDRLVMGNLPLAGVFIFAYSGLPELIVQSQNPFSQIYKPPKPATNNSHTSGPCDVR